MLRLTVFARNAATAAASAAAASTATTASATQEPHPLVKALGGAQALFRNQRTASIGPMLPLEQSLGIQTNSSTSSTSFSDDTTAAANTNSGGAPRTPVKYVMLYFSAAWCPPCRQFTPILSNFYAKHKKSKQFEVVFCSWDQNETEFANYFKTHPEWLAVDRSLVDQLAAQYNIQTIPSLLIIDAETGEIVTRKGRLGVANDPDATEYPWQGINFSSHSFNVNSPKTAMLIGAAATFGASVLLWLFAQDSSSNANATAAAASATSATSAVGNFIATRGGRANASTAAAV